MVEIYNNVTFVVKLLVAEQMFEETLGCDLDMDLFQKKIVVLAEDIYLQNHIY